MDRCLIFGAGVYDEQIPDVPEDCFVIAADAGFEKCAEYGFTPDVAIGDFDSLGLVPDMENTVRLPVEKDITDIAAAALYAVENGCKELHIFGGMGGRPDHTVANYSLIAELSRQGIAAFMYGDGYIVTAVTDGTVELHGIPGTTVSVFSWTERSVGVTLKGLKYPLEDHTLKNTFALGVSNSFSGETAFIRVKSGTLLVMTEFVK